MQQQTIFKWVGWRNHSLVKMTLLVFTFPVSSQPASAWGRRSGVTYAGGNTQRVLLALFFFKRLWLAKNERNNRNTFLLCISNFIARGMQRAIGKSLNRHCKSMHKLILFTFTSQYSWEKDFRLYFIILAKLVDREVELKLIMIWSLVRGDHALCSEADVYNSYFSDVNITFCCAFLLRTCYTRSFGLEQWWVWSQQGRYLILKNFQNFLKIT